MSRVPTIILVVFGTLFFGSINSASGADLNAVARYLAGLPSDGQGQIKADRLWLAHSRALNKDWKRLEKHQLAPMREFARNHLGSNASPVFYFFSGPDLIYPIVMFPDAETYVLVGLELPASMPVLAVENEQSRQVELTRLRRSLQSLFGHGLFITSEMRWDKGRFSGVTSVICVTAARLGFRILAIDPIWLADDGAMHKGTAPESASSVQGVLVHLQSPSKATKRVYYFSADLQDGRRSSATFLKFANTIGQGKSLLRHTSYAMHSGAFSDARGFILANCVEVVQDDSGIPLRALREAKWSTRFFGRYAPPGGKFMRHYQSDLEQASLENGRPAPAFGFGYHWWARGSHITLAVRSQH